MKAEKTNLLLNSLLFIFSFFLILSCGDDGEKTKKEDVKNCNNSCKTWEYCDINTDICMLKNGACNESEDCLHSDDICINNQCIQKTVCQEWEDYIEDTNSCKLSEGRCNSNVQCSEKDTHCNQETHNCEDNFKITFKKDCPDYLSSNAECAMVKLPLDYNNPDGKKIDIFVFRHLSKSPHVKGQIWFLQGGPGGSASSFSKYFFDEYMKTHPEYDYYSLDHRGVGNSSILRCNNENFQTASDFISCKNDLDSQMGNDIKEYSTTNSAKDLGFLIDKLREKNKKVFVNGSSYGTYWAERYLTIFPSQADGVILDSIATLGEDHFDDDSYWKDITGKKFLKICENDRTCNEKMKSVHVDGVALEDVTPEIAMKEVISNRLCRWWNGYSLDEESWKRLLGGNLLLDYFDRIIIPAIIYRANRCDERDKRALGNLKNVILSQYNKKYESREDAMRLNGILYYNVVLSELWYGRTEEEFLEVYNNALFTNGITLDRLLIMNRDDIWNRYTDEYISQTKPDVQTPVLMLQGTLDPQTPIETAKLSQKFLNKNNQYFIEFPEVVHGVATFSITYEMRRNNYETESCGDEIMFKFMENPEQKPDTSCVNDLFKISWVPEGDMQAINSWVSNKLFGTDDMWDGDPADSKKSFKDNSKLDKALNKIIERNQKLNPRAKFSIRK